MLWFGQGWLVFELTESPLYLGYVGLANASSVIALNLFGGVFADKLDKRRLILVTRLTIAMLIFALAALTLFEMVEVWHIMLIAFVAGAVDAFGQPAHDALYPHLIPRKTLVSAVALDEAAWHGTGIVAPALAGLVISLTGTATVFFISGAGFVVMALVMLTLDVPKIPTSSGGNPMRDMAEGLKFIGGDVLFRFLIATLFFNSFFGMSYWQMMPAFSVDILEVGADGQGVLMSLGGVGALAAVMVLGSMSGSSYRGPMIVGGGIGVRSVYYGVRSNLTVFGLVLSRPGPDVNHGSDQHDICGRDYKFAPATRAGEYARQGDGLHQHYLVHRACRRIPDGSDSGTRRSFSGCGYRWDAGRAVRAWPDDHEQAG